MNDGDIRSSLRRRIAIRRSTRDTKLFEEYNWDTISKGCEEE